MAGTRVRTESEFSIGSIDDDEKLPRISMDENEHPIFSGRCVLYRFDKSKACWVKRASGDLYLLQNDKVRIVMRDRRSTRICLNHVVNHTTKLAPKDGSNNAWTWAATDFSGGDSGEEYAFTVRFKTAEASEQFKEAYDTAFKINSSQSGSRGDSSRTGRGDAIEVESEPYVAPSTEQATYRVPHEEEAIEIISEPYYPPPPPTQSAPTQSSVPDEAIFIESEPFEAEESKRHESTYRDPNAVYIESEPYVPPAPSSSSSNFQVEDRENAVEIESEPYVYVAPAVPAKPLWPQDDREVATYIESDPYVPPAASSFSTASYQEPESPVVILSDPYVPATSKTFEAGPQQRGHQLGAPPSGSRESAVFIEQEPIASHPLGGHTHFPQRANDDDSEEELSEGGEIKHMTTSTLPTETGDLREPSSYFGVSTIVVSGVVAAAALGAFLWYRRRTSTTSNPPK